MRSYRGNVGWPLRLLRAMAYVVRVICDICRSLSLGENICANSTFATIACSVECGYRESGAPARESLVIAGGEHRACVSRQLSPRTGSGDADRGYLTWASEPPSMHHDVYDFLLEELPLAAFKGRIVQRCAQATAAVMVSGVDTQTCVNWCEEEF